MNALWLENNKIDLRSVDQPRKPNEALIRIRKAGICSTDLELMKGYYPYTGILGHEFVGEVVSLPSTPSPLHPSPTGRGDGGEGDREASRSAAEGKRHTLTPHPSAGVAHSGRAKHSGVCPERRPEQHLHLTKCLLCLLCCWSYIFPFLVLTNRTSVLQ